MFDWSKIKSVAVIGASNHPDKYGYKVFQDLTTKGYTVFPVNPGEKLIQGVPAYPTVRDLPSVVNLTVFVTPPAVTLKILQENPSWTNVWLQPGAEDDAVVEWLERNKINAVYRSCVLVSGPAKS